MDETDPEASDVSRRTALKSGLAAVGIGISGSVSATAQETTTYQFGGEVSGWQGQAPSSLQGQTNPTLNLQPGTQYEVTWENLDGAPHNFAIHDSGGSAIISSQIISEQGATQTVTFTASENMSEYICEVHPSTMVGNISFGGGPPTAFGLPLIPLLMGGSLLLAFLSPLIFAIILYLVYDERRERTA